MVEQKFGQQVRYPRDCDALAAHICSCCKSRISGSTLRRLYGFTKGTQEPRLYTLDVIGEYLGYRGWEDLSRLLTGSEARPYTELQELEQDQIKKGEKIEIHYEPNRRITIHAIGKGKLRVDLTNDKAVKLGDLLTFEKLRLHYPMHILSIERNNSLMDGCYLGMVSGVTSIRKIQEG